MKSLKSFLFGVMLAISSFVLADNYAFYVTAAARGLADPQYFATRTFQMDQELEFEAANRIVNQYLLYPGARAQLKALDDVIFIVYADGKIAQFTQVRATGTIRLRYDKLVPALPPGAKVLQSSVAVNNGYAEYDIDALIRQDYFSPFSNTYFQVETLRRGSVTVIEYSFSYGIGSEPRCGFGGGYCYLF